MRVSSYARAMSGSPAANCPRSWKHVRTSSGAWPRSGCGHRWRWASRRRKRRRAPSASVPFVGFVSAPAEAPTLTGESIRGDQIDFAARVISNGQPHRALPLTISLCAAVAARIEGTVVASVLPPGTSREGRLRLGMPSGILTVEAAVARTPDGTWEARSGSFYRTARPLFSGEVHVPAM